MSSPCNRKRSLHFHICTYVQGFSIRSVVIIDKKMFFLNTDIYILVHTLRLHMEDDNFFMAMPFSSLFNTIISRIKDGMLFFIALNVRVIGVHYFTKPQRKKNITMLQEMTSTGNLFHNNFIVSCAVLQEINIFQVHCVKFRSIKHRSVADFITCKGSTCIVLEKIRPKNRTKSLTGDFYFSLTCPKFFKLFIRLKIDKFCLNMLGELRLTIKPQTIRTVSAKFSNFL